MSHSEPQGDEVLNSISTLVHGGCLLLVLSLPTENEICNFCFSVVISTDSISSDEVHVEQPKLLCMTKTTAY